MLSFTVANFTAEKSTAICRLDGTERTAVTHFSQEFQNIQGTTLDSE